MKVSLENIDDVWVSQCWYNHFAATHQSVLDLLTDVLEAFFQKICKLVCTVNEEENGEAAGFPVRGVNVAVFSNRNLFISECYWKGFDWNGNGWCEGFTWLLWK